MRRTVVWDGHEARNWTLDYPYAHISMREPEMASYGIPQFPNCKGILDICVADFRSLSQANEESNLARGGPGIMPTPDKFHALPKFLEEMFPQVEGFVANCGAGVSRSSGMALALCLILGHNPRYLYEETFGHNNRRLDPNFLLAQSALIAVWGASFPFDILSSQAALWDKN